MSKFCDICGTTVDDDSIERCPVCFSDKWSVNELYSDLKQISSDESFIQAMIKLHDEDPIEYQLKLQQFKTQMQQQKHIKQQESGKKVDNIPKCPHCQSTNIKSISGLNRGMSIAMLGIFSKKINKSFECKKCGYTW